MDSQLRESQQLKQVNMSLSAPTLGSLISSNLIADGAIGIKRDSFSLAVATGVVNHLTGKTFTTIDAGSGVGGTGIGTGITGLSAANMAATALSLMTSQGPKAPTFILSIMTAVVSHLLTDTTLTTVNPSVGVGVGTVVVGSITVDATALAASIKSQLQSDGAIGSELDNLCLSLATGIATEILAAGTGTVVISGVANLPSGGAGTGVIS